MNKKTTSIIIGAALVIIVGVTVYSTKKPAYVSIPVDTSTEQSTSNAEIGTSVPDQSSVSGSTETSPTPAQSGIALSEVAKHNSKASCWSAINGSVYDLTSWIPNHPGGEQAILSLCGKDGSAGYNRKHGKEARPARILGGFKVGVFIQ